MRIGLVILAILIGNIGSVPKSNKEIPKLTFKWKITWLSFTSFVRELEGFHPTEKEAYQQKLHDAFIRFRQNGTYYMKVFDAKDEGSWQNTGKKLTLQSKQGAKVLFEIDPVSDRELKLLNIQKSDTLLMIVKR